MIEMYKKQEDIYNNILKHHNSNHVIVNSNGVGVSFILMNVVEILKKCTNRKIYIHGIHSELKETFKNLPYEEISYNDYDIKKLDNNSTIVAFNCLEQDLEKYARKVRCNIIRNSTPCYYPNLEDYDYSYFLNAFDTPSFEDISLDDIVNNTYKYKIKENIYTKYLISPDEAKRILNDCDGDINNFEFRTRILGLEPIKEGAIK